MKSVVKNLRHNLFNGMQYFFSVRYTDHFNELMKLRPLKPILAKYLCFAGMVMSLGFFGCSGKMNKKMARVISTATNADNTLTVQEKGEGWELLFNGTNFDGWRILGHDDAQSVLWEIEEGIVHKVNSGEVPSLADGQPLNGGDLMTIKKYDDFELYFEWKILKAGNTGLKYNVSEELSQKYSKHSAIGFEYQLLDDGDTLYAGKLKCSQFTGSLYDLIPANNARPKPVGEFNTSRIIIDGNHVSHWLNGERVVEYVFGSKQLDSVYKLSKYKDYLQFLDKRSGHIVLQNHKDDAWFKNIKIRELNKAENLKPKHQE
ncbi:DUF1080 domain-containing protein [Flagellimonas olearia]|uniref:DUF1080 domain-containing protein n=1 Tax=Flagellimonas olearia TaxID=552546 RepID=A0A6I1E1C9_9FLAO|nr:DUF1080 domain-containing protein [Allomuricauda olearia]KAB7530402.1 DUF1080 domain-containing protein [Allomuricauda olearia]